MFSKVNSGQDSKFFVTISELLKKLGKIFGPISSWTYTSHKNNSNLEQETMHQYICNPYEIRVSNRLKKH